MKSVMKHDFSRSPQGVIQRSSFDRSHGYKTTFDAGILIPCFVDEVLPGDTFKLNVSAFARLATPIAPFMDNLRVDFQFFSVPYRLVWDNWEKFNGQQDNPGDSTDYLIPTVTSATGPVEQDIYDYFGIPTKAAGVTFSALPLRAYNLIYNQWYRSEDLINSQPVSKDDGPDTESEYKLMRRNKRHDYFTSCLPWPQKGPAVEMPLGSSAPIILNPSVQPNAGILRAASNHGINPAVSLNSNVDANLDSTTGAASGLMIYDPNDTLWTDLTNATASTVNALRQSFQIQRVLERDARGGTRYTEIIKSFFGVDTPDMRVQRAEFLGAFSTAVNINQVEQTSETSQTTPQGNLAAFGVAAATNKGFTKSFTEHCVVIGIMSARADLTYQKGLERFWSRQTRYDFYLPTLAHLGEQAVLNKEIYYNGTETDDQVFGYQERFAEYRYKPSKITGLFRSNAAQTLDYWHLSENFNNLPTLGQLFIEENPPIDRVSAVQTEPHFLIDIYYDLKCTRPMPMYSVPGLVDHF